MTERRKGWKRPLIITGIAIVAIFILVIAFISPITKFVVEKYSVKWTGRQIRMGYVYLNPFTGHIHISKLKIYENKSDSIFFSADGLTADFAITKLLSKTYEIKDATLDRPWGIVIQNRRAFNFDDLIQKFTPKGPKDTTPKPPIKLNILNLKINNGEFHYIEQSIPVNYYIKDVNIESPGIRWNVDTMAIKIALRSGPSTGDIKGDFVMNLKTMEYSVAAQVKKFDLHFVQQYVRDLANFGSLNANLDADIKTKGNFKDELAMDLSGFVAVNDLHLGKEPGNDFLSFDKLALNMTEINPRGSKFIFDTVVINRPYFKYERYDSLDNIQRMFGAGGEKVAAANADSAKFNLIIQIAHFINNISKNFLQSYYKANKVAIYDGNIQFNDFSLADEFSVAADPLNILSDSIDKNNNRFNVAVNIGLKPYGDIAVALSADPQDYGYFDVNYKLEKLPVAMFNPYIVTYTSFPLDRGTLEFKGKFDVTAGNINSDNHLLIIDPRVAKKEKKKDTKWIPVPLIMAFARNPGEVIDFSIPIKGNMKSPKFKFKDVILSVLSNMFVKPPTLPYLQHIQNTQGKEEAYLVMKWYTNSTSLTPKQEKFAGKIADFLKKDHNNSITIDPVDYGVKEKEDIVMFEAKKKYFLTTHKESSKNLTTDDSIYIEKMSIKDKGFLNYVNKQVPDTLQFAIQRKCDTLISRDIVNARYDQLLKAREQTLLSFFVKYGTADQVKFSKGESIIPYDGFSYYKIAYNGKIPDGLRKAYEEMQEVEDAAPLNKYQKARNRNGGLLPEDKEAK